MDNDLQHIGGAWECEDEWTDDAGGIVDAFPMPAVHPGEWFTPAAAHVSFAQLMNALDYATRNFDAERGTETP